MLAKELILQRLEQSYVSLMSIYVDNEKIGKIDSTLECHITNALSLIKIYPWLEEGELEEWRDKVEEICDCTLPCVNCQGAGDIPDFDPSTMRWVIDSYKCEKVETKWIEDNKHCEDDGITTTIPQPTTTFIPFSTTIPQGQDCRNNINFIYKLASQGPAEIPFKYVDCNGIVRNDVFVKGIGKCISFIFGTVVPINPEDLPWFNAGQFNIGIYPCGANDTP